MAELLSGYSATPVGVAVFPREVRRAGRGGDCWQRQQQTRQRKPRARHCLPAAVLWCGHLARCMLACRFTGRRARGRQRCTTSCTGPSSRGCAFGGRAGRAACACVCVCVCCVWQVDGCGWCCLLLGSGRGPHTAGRVTLRRHTHNLHHHDTERRAATLRRWSSRSCWRMTSSRLPTRCRTGCEARGLPCCARACSQCALQQVQLLGRRGCARQQSPVSLSAVAHAATGRPSHTHTHTHTHCGRCLAGAPERAQALTQTAHAVAWLRRARRATRASTRATGAAHTQSVVGLPPRASATAGACDSSPARSCRGPQRHHASCSEGRREGLCDAARQLLHLLVLLGAARRSAGSTRSTHTRVCLTPRARASPAKPSHARAPATRAPSPPPPHTRTMNRRCTAAAASSTMPQ
jgi:hypothetical protein